MTENFDKLVNIIKNKQLTEEQKLQGIKPILDEDKSVLSETGDIGGTILHYATDTNNPEVVQYLLKYGADPMAKDSNDNLPIHYAAGCKFPLNEFYWETVKVFLDNNVGVNIQGSDGNTILHYAVSTGNLEIISKLIEEYHADVNIKNNAGATPLYCAAESGSLEVVNKLIEYEANTKASNSLDELTLLHVATLRGNIEIVKKFFNGIDLNSECDRCLPLHYVPDDSPHYDEIIKMFCEHGTDLNTLDNNLDTILYSSTLFAKVKAVKYLLNNGADINNKRLEVYKGVYDDEDDKKELYDILFDEIDYSDNPLPYIEIFRVAALHIAKLEAAEMAISDSNLQLRDEFIDSTIFGGQNEYTIHNRKYKKEIEKLEKEDKLLYNLLKEDDINKQINIWIKRKSEKVHKNGKRQKIGFDIKDFKEKLKGVYPEYSGMIIYKINQTEKEIFTRNNKLLIDALTKYYGWYNLQNISYSDLATFLAENRDYLTEELRGSGLISGNIVNIIDDNTNTLAPPYSLRTLAAAQYVSDSKLDNPDVQQVTQNVVSK